jgi:three-Cys-motif partner protein
MPEIRIDEVGYWTEIKLQILREYSSAYAQILGKQPYIRHYAYIDGFAGAGSHVSKTTGMEIEGSPAIALKVQPPFSYYHFIDLSGERAARIRRLAAGHANVTVYEGDCNKVLLEQVFPQCRYDQFRRALCLLDPYDLNPNWEVVETAGKMKSIEIFLNFMIMDANMNVLKKNPDAVLPAQVQRMTEFWGDESWRQVAYMKHRGLFGDIELKSGNDAVVTAYRNRLQKVAGFAYVPEPIPMRNSTGSIIYYLVFASNNKTGDKIARAIFNKWKNRGVPHGA